MVNITSCGTYQMDNLAVANVNINTNKLDKSVKALVIDTDGALRFSNNPVFTPNQDIIQITQMGVPAVTALNYTEIRAQKVYNIAPLMVMGGENVHFTITNASGAVRVFQIDLIY